MTSQRAVPDGPGGNRREVGRGTQASSERPFPDGGPGHSQGPAPVSFADRDEGRGVDGHASQRRNGTGRWNPAQGFLVRGQRHRESVGTLVGPIQAGIESGRPSSEPTSQGGERVDTNPHPADARTGPGVQAGARPAFGGWRC